jgi:energy-coupling factor transporter transmembrane protein EcfT
MESKKYPISPLILLINCGLFIVTLFCSMPFYHSIILIILWLGALFYHGRLWLQIKRISLHFWPYLLISFVLHSLLSGQLSALISSFPLFEIDTHSITLAAFFTLRLFIIFVTFGMLFQVHNPLAYGRELGRVFSQLRFGQEHVRNIELIASLSINYIPFVQREFGRLRWAFHARGLSDKTIVEKIKNLKRILFPLILNTISHADHVAIALKARGFNVCIKRTYSDAYAISIGEAIGTAIFGVFCLFLVFLK